MVDVVTADRLGQFVLTKFNEASQARQFVRVRGTSLEGALDESLRLRDGLVDPKIAAYLRELNIDPLVINIVERKCADTEAWITDTLINAEDAPFVIKPTPIPSLSDSDEAEALRLIRQLVTASTDMSITEAVKQHSADVKRMMTERARARAQLAAEGMQTALYDQLVEGGYRNQMTLALRDFCTYPFAVMQTLRLQPTMRGTWRGSNWVERPEIVPTISRISPHDFFPSADSGCPRTGAFVIIRAPVTKHSLMETAKLPGAVLPNIQMALTKAVSMPSTVTHRPHASVPYQTGQAAADGADNTGLVFYGLLSSRELEGYVDGLDMDKLYEVRITVSYGYATHIVVVPHSMKYDRPFAVASYRQGEHWLGGHSVATLVAECQRLVNHSILAMRRNLSYSSGPIGEIDVSRLDEGAVPKDGAAFELSPYEMTPVSRDPSSGGRPAMHIHNIRSITAEVTNLVSQVMQWADGLAGVPSYVNGGSDVGTLGRTFRGMAMQYGNAARGLKLALGNLDKGIVEPIARDHYTYVMQNGADPTIKGDATVMARGAAGLVEAEVEAAQATERLQTLAPVMQSLAPEVQRWAIDRLLEAVKIPRSLIDAAGKMPAAGDGGAAPGPAPAAAAAPAPNGNPGTELPSI